MKLRPPPESVKERKEEKVFEEEKEEKEEEKDEPIYIPEQEIRQKISRLIIDANQIEFGDLITVQETVKTR